MSKQTSNACEHRLKVALRDVAAECTIKSFDIIPKICGLKGATIDEVNASYMYLESPKNMFQCLSMKAQICSRQRK